MTPMKYILLTEVYGKLEAEALRAYLNAVDVDAQIFQEGASEAYAMTVGPLARVQVFVPEEKVETARELLADYLSSRDDIQAAEPDEDGLEEKDE